MIKELEGTNLVKLAEDVWLFLTNDSMPGKAEINKEAFIHEVSAMLKHVLDTPNSEKDEDYEFRIKIQKKNPKKGAKTYKFVTIQDIFDVITEKNINKFCREFKQALSVGIATRKLINVLAKSDGIEVKDDILKMPSLTWIDD